MANDANYYSSAANTSPVGILVGQFIDFLVSRGATYSQFHIIGFSLGAHVAGKAGATASGTIPRVTGKFDELTKLLFILPKDAEAKNTLVI